MILLERAARALKEELCATKLSNGLMLVENKFTEEDFCDCVRAVLAVVRDDIEEGPLAGAEQAVEHGSGAAQHAVDAYRHVIDMIDAALAEEGR